MADDKKKKADPGYIEKLLQKYSPFHILTKKLDEAGKPVEKKSETEKERKARLMQQALLGAGVAKKK